MAFKTPVGGRELRWTEVPGRGLRYLWNAGLARYRLRHLDALGPGPITFGRPRVIIEGTARVGKRFLITSTAVPSTLEVEAGGELIIGDDVRMNYGCEIHCYERIEVGDRVSMGHYVHVMDSNGHGVAFRDAKSTRPVVIESDVWLAQRVSVLPGVRIGRGTIVTSGSVVRTDLPSGVIATGNPATVQKDLRDLSPQRLQREWALSVDKVARLPLEEFRTWREPE